MCSQTGPNIRKTTGHTHKDELTYPKVFVSWWKVFFQRESRQQHLFSTSQVSVKFCCSTQTTVEKQGNHWQHQGCWEWLIEGWRGDGETEQHSLHSSTGEKEGGCNSFPLSMKIKRHSMLKSKHLLDNLQVTTSASGFTYIFHPALKCSCCLQ